jgi:hypothetical protein
MYGKPGERNRRATVLAAKRLATITRSAHFSQAELAQAADELVGKGNE